MVESVQRSQTVSHSPRKMNDIPTEEEEESYIKLWQVSAPIQWIMEKQEDTAPSGGHS